MFPNRNPKTPPAQAAHAMMSIRIGSFITSSDPQGIGLLTSRNHKPTPAPVKDHGPAQETEENPFLEWDGEEGTAPHN